MKKCIFILAILFLAGCAGPEPAVIEFHGDKKDISVPLSIQRTSEIGGVPATEVDIDGHSLNFLVDTGASHCVIDLSLVERLNLSEGRLKRVILFGGVRQGHLTEIKTLRLGSATFRNVEAVILDLSLFRDELGIEVEGFLGGTVLSQVPFTLDFNGGRMILHQKQSVPVDGPPMSFGLRNGLPVIPFGLTGDVRQNFILDTGSAAALILLQGYIEELKIDAADYPSVNTKELGGTLKPHFARLSRLEFSRSALRDVPVMLLPGQKSGDIGGFIGTGLMENYRITFDYGKRLLWLSPIHERLSMAGGLGMVLKQDRDGVLVRWVAEAGPAHEAGIQPGDRLVSVEGHAPQSVAAIWSSLHGKARAKFTVLRADDLIPYTLPRAQYLPPLIIGKQ